MYFKIVAICHFGFVGHILGLLVSLYHLSKFDWNDGIHSVVLTVQRYAGTVYAVVMCLFVCLSVTRRYCIKTAKLKIMHYRTIAQGL